MSDESKKRTLPPIPAVTAPRATLSYAVPNHGDFKIELSEQEFAAVRRVLDIPEA